MLVSFITHHHPCVVRVCFSLPHLSFVVQSNVRGFSAVEENVCLNGAMLTPSSNFTVNSFLLNVPVCVCVCVQGTGGHLRSQFAALPVRALSCGCSLVDKKERPRFHIYIYISAGEDRCDAGRLAPSIATYAAFSGPLLFCNSLELLCTCLCMIIPHCDTGAWTFPACAVAELCTKPAVTSSLHLSRRSVFAFGDVCVDVRPRLCGWTRVCVWVCACSLLHYVASAGGAVRFM